MPARRILPTFTLAIVLATPSVAMAARDPDAPRPWGKGTMMPTFGFGLGLGREATQIGFGLGFRYFVAGGLGLGLSLSNSITIFSESLKSEYPGLTKRIPTNIFRITPSAQYVFYRSRWFSPYVHAGVGPSFLNNKGGTLGHWVAGPGAYIGIGGPVYLNVGVDFSSMFPAGKCDRAYRYAGEGGDVQFKGYCGFSWGPNIGIVVSFGGRSTKRAPPPSSPPRNPMPDVFDAPSPASPPPEPPAQEVPPVEETPPVETAPVETPPAETPPTPAGPPSEAPPGSLAPVPVPG